MPVVADAALPKTGLAHQTALRRVLREPAFWIAGALYAATTCVVFAVAWRLCGGRFVYALDDVYINMAVAKNFATHGVWGVTPYEFNSTTSSPLYVLLLSGVYRVAGVNWYAPAVLSWVFGLAALYAGAGLLRRTLRTEGQILAMVAVVLLTPMFLLGTLGMEHSLHVFAALLFLAVFQSEEEPAATVAFATALLCAARYEGLLMAGAAAAVLLLRCRWKRAAMIAVAAAVPVAGYAWFSIAHGGSWLPNSVLLKGVDVAGSGWLARLVPVWETIRTNAIGAPYLPLMSIALLLVAGFLWKRNPALGGMLGVVGAAGVLHLATAAVGWGFRYEAYLVATGIIALACAWPEMERAAKSGVVVSSICLLSLAFLFLTIRATLCGALLPQFSRAIYEQQGQMAQFFKTYYPGGSVAANDIGYITYETDVHCLDLAGLASSEVFNAKRAGRDTTEFLESTARTHGVQVAVVYESLFSNGAHAKLGGPKLPASWEKVGEWSVPERLQLGGKTVTFFGTNPANDERLREHLEAFAGVLPKRVSVRVEPR